MSELKTTSELNREAAYYTRLGRAVNEVLDQLDSEGIKAEEKQLSFLVEAVPPIYTEDAIRFMSGLGLRVASTNFSQHVFKLDVGQADGL